MSTRYAVAPRNGLPFCVPLNVALNNPTLYEVSWRDYRDITGQHGLRGWWRWAWRTTYAERQALYYAAEALHHAREGRCYEYQGVQVHFCEHRTALGLKPRGGVGVIPDEFRQRILARERW